MQRGTQPSAISIQRSAKGFTPLLLKVPTFRLGRNIVVPRAFIRLKKRRPSRRGVTGFTLIEVLMAVGLFAFGMLALAALFTAEGVGTDFARQQSAATMLAQQKLEEFIQTSYSAISTGNGNEMVNEQGSTSIQTGQTSFTRAWTVTDCSLASNANAACTCETGVTVADMKAICITVSWTGRQNETHNVRTRINKGNILLVM